MWGAPQQARKGYQTGRASVTDTGSLKVLHTGSFEMTATREEGGVPMSYMVILNAIA